MLVCDRIIRDARTDRVSLIDIVGEVSAPSFPVRMAPVSVYARLTEAVGTYALTLDVVRRHDLVVVATFDIGNLDATDPIEDSEILVHQVPVALPSAGFYDVRLWANKRFVHSVSFQALE